VATGRISPFKGLLQYFNVEFKDVESPKVAREQIHMEGTYPEMFSLLRY
jgi:hypothetical protein